VKRHNNTFSAKSFVKHPRLTPRNKPRWSAPIGYYANHVSTYKLMISGDIEVNPGPVICQECQKTVRKNSKRLECEVCKEFVHQKCLKDAVINMTNQQTSWTCSLCAFSTLPFHNVRDILTVQSQEFQVAEDQSDEHLQILSDNRNLLSVAHLNTQSMISTFDQFTVFAERYKFDIITMSETWLKDNPHLLEYVKIPGYATFFNNRNANRRGGGVGAYVKEGLKCKVSLNICGLNLTVKTIVGCSYVYCTNQISKLMQS